MSKCLKDISLAIVATWLSRMVEQWDFPFYRKILKRKQYGLCVLYMSIVTATFKGVARALVSDYNRLEVCGWIWHAMGGIRSKVLYTLGICRCSSGSKIHSGAETHSHFTALIRAGCADLRSVLHQTTTCICNSTNWSRSTAPCSASASPTLGSRRRSQCHIVKYFDMRASLIGGFVNFLENYDNMKSVTYLKI